MPSHGVQGSGAQILAEGIEAAGHEQRADLFGASVQARRPASLRSGTARLALWPANAID